MRIVFTVIAVFATLFSSGCVLTEKVSQKADQHSAYALLLPVVMPADLVVSPMVGLEYAYQMRDAGDGSGSHSSQAQRKAELLNQQKFDDWQNLGAKVNPLLREYYLANKSKCKFPYNDNEAEIEGFVDYAAKHGVPVKKGQIIDPWGDPTHLVIARERDDALRARGQFYGIFGQSSDEIAVGLVLDKPSCFDKSVNSPWALVNGYIPNHK